MARLEILNPVAKTVEHSVKPAARLQGVDGATIETRCARTSGCSPATPRS